MNWQYLSQLADNINKEAMRLRVEYLKKFSTGDRVVHTPFQYVNILEAETNSTAKIKLKGIFIEAREAGQCLVKWEDRDKPEYCDVMYIKLDDNA